MRTLILLLTSIALSSFGYAQQNIAFKTMKWLGEPAKWSLENNKLSIQADAKTDFWQITHYGYTTDNGHFYYDEVEGDFETLVKITGSYKDLYDQAGLMIRIDSANWIKSGVEFVNGGLNISAVFTRVFSDWSVIDIKTNTIVWLKLIRKGDSVELSYSLNGTDFQLQRLGYFPPKVKAKIGVMAAAPEGKGFEVLFENFEVRKR
jgi:regulation of enolase protein 1 (concanavalin A-like superfamily)